LEVVKHFSDIFSDIFWAFGLDRRGCVKEKTAEKKKKKLKKLLTAADFRAKAPPYPPDKSPPKGRLGTQFALAHPVPTV